MMSPLNQELHELISAICDETIDEQGMARLDVLLRDDPQARWQYVQSMELHFEIDRCYGVSPVGGDARRAVGQEMVELPRPEVASGRVALESRSRPARLATGFAGAIEWRRHPVRFAAVSAMLTVLLWFGWWLVIGLGPNSQVASRSSVPDAARAPVVARLIRTIRPEWQAGVAAPFDGAFLQADGSLHLRSGLAEVRFNSGARVVLEGPAELRLDAPNAARLVSGRLTATVPEPARGFAVDCGSMTITDLGTEFGVAVLEEDRIDVAVFNGLVEVAAGSEHRSSAGAAYTLGAGETVRFAVDPLGGLVVADSPAAAPESFVRRAALSDLTARLIRPVGAVASSEYDNGLGLRLVAEHLIDGSGLSAESMSATHRPGKSAEGMWHTGVRTTEDAGFRDDRGMENGARATGPCVVAEQYVIFDLGGPFELSGALVWGYNQNDRGRGVQDFQLLVSTTPHGDDFLPVDGGPFSLQRTHAGNQSVSAERIEFQAERVRRVKLQVLTNHADEAHGHVGLSEVRFWGAPVNDE